MVGYASNGFIRISSKYRKELARTGISAQSAHKRGDQHGSDKEYGSKCHGRPIINFLVRKKRPI